MIARSPKELQQIIHAVAAFIASPSLDVPLVGETLLFNRETSYNTTTEVEDSLPIVSFDLPITNLKQLLELAHRIQLLTTLFLKTHLQRLNTLTPQHLAKPNFVFSSYPFRKYPDGKTFNPCKTGSASWVEEYRVVRALWRLQLFCLLTKPNTRATSSISQEASLIECAIPYRQHEMKEILSHLTNWEIDEMLGVQDYLESARISLRAPPSTAHESDFSTNDNTFPSPSTQSESSTHVPPVLPNLAISPLNDTVFPSRNNHNLIAIKHSTEAYNFFHQHGLCQPTSPLQRSHWINFRRLGFGIWDHERMYQMELCRPPAAMRDQYGGKDMSIDDVAFTWKSVEAAGEKEGKDGRQVEEVEGKLNGLSLGTKSGTWKGGGTVLKKEEKAYTGLKGLMRSRTRVVTNGSNSDRSSPRTSAESLRTALRS